MEHLSLIHNKPLLKTNFTKPSIISYQTEIPLRHACENKNII